MHTFREHCYSNNTTGTSTNQWKLAVCLRSHVTRSHTELLPVLDDTRPASA